MVPGYAERRGEAGKKNRKKRIKEKEQNAERCGILAEGRLVSSPVTHSFSRRSFNMTLIWNLFYPLMLYDCVIALCRYFLVLCSDLYVQAVSAAITAGILGLFYKRSISSSMKALKKRTENKPSAIHLTIYLIMEGISSCIFLNLLMEMIGFRQWFSGYESVSEILFEPPLWIQIIAMGFLIPAAEELIFRGFTFRVLREKYSFAAAAVISSLIFGIYHGNVTQAVYACGIALLLAWCYEQCGTILAPWLVHGAANITAVLGENAAGEMAAGELSAGRAAVILTISGVILVLAFWGIRAGGNKNMNKQKNSL